MFFSSNLKLLRKNKQLSQEATSQKLDLTRSSYSGYENGIAEPSIEVLIRISSFFKVSLDDLIKKDFSKLTKIEWETHAKGIQVDAKGEKLRILTTVLDDKNEELIEMIPQKARAGYTSGYADPEYLKVLPTFNLPFLSKNKKYRSFPIMGDSMPPINNGAQVIGEYIQNWENIKNGHPYIVVTKEDGIVFKIIHKIDDFPDKLQLLSTNPIYKPYTISYNDVLELWKFVSYISNELPEVSIPENDMLKSIKGLQKEVHEMKNYFISNK